MKDFDFQAINPEAVREAIRRETEEKGSLALTDLANAAVEKNAFLSAIAEAIGESPFEFVLKSAYDEKLAMVVVKQNPAVLDSLLPAQYSDKIRIVADEIQKNELKANAPVFQAYKRAICSELTKAILVESEGSVTLEWDQNYGTDFKFTHAHTSEAKKQAIAEKREAKANGQNGAGRTADLRNRFRRGRG